MAITSGFFNSVNHDRVYNAEEMSNYFEGLVYNGVYETVGNALQVVVNDGLTVNVLTGRAMIDCRWLKNDTAYGITLEASDLQLDRIDRIVVKLDLTNRQMTLEAVKGEFASNPTPPTVTDTDTVKYLTIAYVKVNHGATSLIQDNIQDRRGTSDCPYVTALGKGIGVQKLQNSYVVETEQSTYSINIEGFNKSTDVLLVNLNGIMLIEDVEFDVTNNGYNAAIQLKNNRTIKPGNRLTFIVLKSR